MLEVNLTVAKEAELDIAMEEMHEGADEGGDTELDEMLHQSTLSNVFADCSMQISLLHFLSLSLATGANLKQDGCS